MCHLHADAFVRPARCRVCSGAWPLLGSETCVICVLCVEVSASVSVPGVGCPSLHATHTCGWQRGAEGRGAAGAQTV